jgi:nucleoside-diphosphate-sugar epimerase
MAAQLKPASQRATVLLLGATGQVGLFALLRLVAAGHSIIALSRKIPVDSGGVSATPGLNWFHPDAVERMGGGMVQDVDVLLSCGPVELAARWAPLCPRLQRVVCISTSSVYTKLASADAAERRLIAGIQAAEDALKRCCRQRDIALFLLRPTMIYGCGLDHNVSRMARWVRRFHFMPLAGKASGLRQPVHADDLAKLALSVLEARGLLGLECPVGGGSVISYREMVERIFTAVGLSPRTLRFPPALLALLVRAVSWLPLMGGLNTGYVFRQNMDMVFDDSLLRDQLGFAPRPFAPTPADFTVPQQARDLQPL